MRQALGTAVFFGMLGVTGFGLFLTPVFYVVITWFKERRDKRRAVASTQSAPAYWRGPSRSRAATDCARRPDASRSGVPPVPKT